MTGADAAGPDTGAETEEREARIRDLLAACLPDGWDALDRLDTMTREERHAAVSGLLSRFYGASHAVHRHHCELAGVVGWDEADRLTGAEQEKLHAAAGRVNAENGHGGEPGEEDDPGPLVPAAVPVAVVQEYVAAVPARCRGKAWEAAQQALERARRASPQWLPWDPAAARDVPLKAAVAVLAAVSRECPAPDAALAEMTDALGGALACSARAAADYCACGCGRKLPGGAPARTRYLKNHRQEAYKRRERAKKASRGLSPIRPAVASLPVHEPSLSAT